MQVQCDKAKSECEKHGGMHNSGLWQPNCYQQYLKFISLQERRTERSCQTSLINI